MKAIPYSIPLGWLLPVLLFILLMALLSCRKKTGYTSYEEYPAYDGTDLGYTLDAEGAFFRLWAPTADAVRFHLYEEALGGSPRQTLSMKRGESGTWTLRLSDPRAGQYYTFQTRVNGQWRMEVPDPYAVAVGTNGRRGQIVDLDETDPEGWSADRRPPLAHPTDIVLYELHVRDLSTHPSSGIVHKGKFLGLAETGTRSPTGLATGLDHMAELGITHVHLLPAFDFRSIDETRLSENAFNWGYDPQNYNTPEGSYSTDPSDGRVRIREFKQMVQALHQRGIRVVMDVVYNHTGYTEESLFNQLVPGYYYRQNEDGGFSDASACGNETASERPMVRKMIVESVLHWVREYHVDGFRFDLMGIHDLETMNAVARALREVDPTIFVYGEGWTAGPTPLPDEQLALKKNTHRLEGVAAFSDDLRDGLKGSVFEHDETGFVSGKAGLEESIKFGLVASTKHPQVDYEQVNYSDTAWAAQPNQTISYVSCHDNHTLWDKLKLSRPEASPEDRKKMHRLALTVVLTAQGVPFLHAGTEMLRTKYGEENSYQSPDSINQINWNRKEMHLDMVEYVRGLIALRKAHPAFRMRTTAEIAEHLRFLDLDTPNVVAYRIDGAALGDPWRDLLVAYNGNAEARAVPVPQGTWKVALLGGSIYPEKTMPMVGESNFQVPGTSAAILIR